MTEHPTQIAFQTNALTMSPLSDLKPYTNNPRTHSKKQTRQIADSIKAFGWTNPVLIDADGGVIAGHGRIEAAKLLGIKEAPVLRLDHMTEAQKRAYIIADNKLAEKAGWDEDLLSIELSWLIEDGGLEIGVTGFETAEIDLLLSDEVADEAPVMLPTEGAEPINRAGDAWSVGPHRLVCGSALDRASYAALLGDQNAQLVFTDPPYNVPIAGHVSGLGQIRHREFAMASGEMSEDAFTGFLHTAFGNAATVSTDGAIHFVCMDWRHMGEILKAGQGVYSELKNLCVWAKTNAGMGSFYRSQHELVFVWKAGKAPHINTFGLGETGRHRSNLWTYAGANTFHEGRMDDLAVHPTVKPVSMVREAIFDCSTRGSIVLDPFAGSGTTLIAAAAAGRVGAGIELDPIYADLILQRLEAATGETAIHDETFAGLNELKELRSTENSK